MVQGYLFSQLMKHNYLVSVFVYGKNINSYFSENLDDLVTIKAIHKNCEIHIFDYEKFAHLTPEQVEREIVKSGKRWKSSLKKTRTVAPAPPRPEKPKKEKRGKNWERRVLCVETGQVFSSIRECSDKTGIPYMTISNCIKNKNATRGVHFVNAPKTIENIIYGKEN